MGSLFFEQVRGDRLSGGLGCRLRRRLLQSRRDGVNFGVLIRRPDRCWSHLRPKSKFDPKDAFFESGEAFIDLPLLDG